MGFLKIQTAIVLSPNDLYQLLILYGKVSYEQLKDYSELVIGCIGSFKDVEWIGNGGILRTDQ